MPPIGSQNPNLDGLVQASKNIATQLGSIASLLNTSLQGPFLPTTGGTMSGNINMGTHNITNVGQLVINGGTSNEFLKADGTLDSTLYETCLFSQTSTVTVANSSVETTLVGTGIGSVTIPANYFSVGTTLKIRGYGFHTASGSPNITVKIKFGSSIILNTGAQSSGNSTNALVYIDAILTCRSTGASGTLQAQGYYQESGGGINNFPMVNITTTTFDTTVSQTVDITVQWGTASTGNSISLSNLAIEAII